MFGGGGGGEEEMEVSNNAVNNNLEHVRYLCSSYRSYEVPVNRGYSIV